MSITPVRRRKEYEHMNVKKYIRECDDRFADILLHVAEKIRGRGARLISLSGPTCSGKTTAALMLEHALESSGCEVHTVSIDDFYYDREYLHSLSEKKGSDEIDYDSEETIDLDALALFVREVMEGRESHCPTFDFSAGRRNGCRVYKAKERDVFIFEGIQAIYPKINALLAPYGTASIYIAPMTPIHDGEHTFLPDDIRLMRRLVRDTNFRGADARFTLTLWKSVRRNEKMSIFPYADGCEYKIDSTHAYEIGVLKPYLERILPPVTADAEHGAAARAILENIEGIKPIDSALIPEGSLYKEFV